MRATLLLTALLAVPLAVHAHGDTHGDAHAHDGHAPVHAAEQTPWGIAGDPAAVSRTIAVDMADAMRFTPDSLAIREGETVRFVVTNRGQLLHELVIGTPEALAEHAALMAKFPGMAHDEAYMTHVDPGRTGEIVWHFNRPGRFEFACLIAGHYEAGMRGSFVVALSKGAEK